MALPPRRCVLLAEDNPDDRLLFDHAWKDVGVSAPLLMVEDGEKVAAYLQGHGTYAHRAAFPPPGLLILDLNMPRRDGFETLEWLRAQPVFKPLPVIVLSGSVLPGDVERAYRAGVNAFLMKPSDHPRLIELVRGIDLFWLRGNVFPQSGP